MINLKFTEAITIACQYENLSKALAYMASWEIQKASTRAIKEPNFEYVFDILLKEYDIYKRSEMTDALINIAKNTICIDAITFRNDYYIHVKEHGLLIENDWSQLMDFETKYNAEVHVRAYQNRSLDDNYFCGLQKIWTRE